MKDSLIVENFRENLAFELKRQGLNQKWLAEQLDVSANTVCFWLQGKKNPSLIHAQKTAVLLRASLDDMLRLSNRLYEQHTRETAGT